MKKCPYCAELIQEQAIVCRYCGRDLPKPQQTKDNDTSTSPTIVVAPKSSIWKQGAKAGAVITALYVISQLIRPQTSNELIFNLTAGLLVTFLVWSLVSSCIVWLWRKFGAGTFVGLSILIGLLIVLLYVGFNTSNPQTSHPISGPTQPPLPTTNYQATLQWSLQLTQTVGPHWTIPACPNWTMIEENNLGQTLCITGLVYKVTSIWGSGENYDYWTRTRIDFDNDPNNFFVYVKGNSGISLSSNCIVVTGEILQTVDGVPYMDVLPNAVKVCN